MPAACRTPIPPSSQLPVFTFGRHVARVYARFAVRREVQWSVQSIKVRNSRGALSRISLATHPRSLVDFAPQVGDWLDYQDAFRIWRVACVVDVDSTHVQVRGELHSLPTSLGVALYHWNSCPHPPCLHLRVLLSFG